MAMMRVAQVSRAGGPLELVERDVPEPGPGEVRVRIEPCGVCRGDSLTVEGQWPGLSLPRIPGHEIAGVIDKLGAGGVGCSTTLAAQSFRDDDAVDGATAKVTFTSDQHQQSLRQIRRALPWPLSLRSMEFCSASRKHDREPGLIGSRSPRDF